MNDNKNLCIKVDEDICENAKSILKQFGIPMSLAVNIFLRQVILRQGFPFDIDTADTQSVSIYQ